MMLTITCDQNTIVNKIIINNSGKLSLKTNCLALTSSTTLCATINHLESQLETIPINISLLEDNCCLKLKNKTISKPINLEKIESHRNKVPWII